MAGGSVEKQEDRKSRASAGTADRPLTPSAALVSVKLSAGMALTGTTGEPGLSDRSGCCCRLRPLQASVSTDELRQQSDTVRQTRKEMSPSKTGVPKKGKLFLNTSGVFYVFFTILAQKEERQKDKVGKNTTTRE